MHLVEFIEAIGRVADRLNLPHFIFDRQKDFDDPSLKKKERPLSLKIESFIIFLVRNTLEAQEFNNYLKNLRKVIEE